MDWLEIICSYASDAHWIMFIMLMMAGLNIPISEDVLLITAGALAATCIPEQKWHLYAWVFAGCWISGSEAYWIGRLLGPKLYNIRWFNRVLTPARIEKLHEYYEKFGIWTFIVGRFIPGGIRNALFMSSGLGKMPYKVFLIRDFIACLISSITIFSLGYEFAEHYELIVQCFHTYSQTVFFFLIGTIGGLLIWYFSRKKQQVAQ